MEKKFCKFCGQVIQGRIDKKFCDDYCRSTFNNKQKQTASPQLKIVDSILKRNRRILEAILMQHNAVEVHLYERNFKELGFVFGYHTHTESLEGGNTCYYCYDYAYIQSQNGEFAIIKVK